MRCISIVAFACKGLVLPEQAPDVILLNMPFVATSTIVTSAVLTRKTEDRLFLIDRASALKTLALSSIFHSPDSREFDERLAEKIDQIRRDRAQITGSVPTLIVTVEQETTLKSSARGAHHKEFSVYFDSFEKSELSDKAQPLINRFLASLMLSTDSDPIFKELARGVYLVGADPKIIYPFRLEGTASLIAARQIPPEVPSLLSRYFKALADEDLARIYELISSAVEQNTEPLRAYIAAWTALEMFINKTFSFYEGEWFKEAIKNRGTIERRHLERIREVMKGKYSLEDRFGVVSMMLDEPEADKSYDLFKAIKKERDELIHHGFGNRKDFMTGHILALLRNLLKKHLDRDS